VPKGIISRFDGETDRLNGLQAGIDSAMDKLGFPKEKRSYKPHVTIGQDVVLKRDFKEIVGGYDYRSIPQIEVGSVHLFKSEQIGNKRVYTALHEFKFRQDQK